jgi:hypothetical protein
MTELQAFDGANSVGRTLLPSICFHAVHPVLQETAAILPFAAIITTRVANARIPPNERFDLEPIRKPNWY